MSKKIKMSDAELMEIELTPQEKRALEMRLEKRPDGEPYSYEDISKAVFRKKVSRQRAYEMVKYAEQKQWRLNAKQRHAGNLENCPIDELPLPGRVRNALKDAGYRNVGELAGKFRNDLAKIEGLGRRHGSFLVYGLLQLWGVRKPGRFCPNCGAALGVKATEEKQEVKCAKCGARATIKVKIVDARIM
jgi:DNA-directed RNA polymerase subunit RPC12/RpoP